MVSFSCMIFIKDEYNNDENYYAFVCNNIRMGIFLCIYECKYVE